MPEGGMTPASTASKTKSESAKPRTALIMKSLANEFFKTMADGARKHQGEHSSEYELIVNGIKDERDLKRQVDLVEEMVAQRVDAIVHADQLAVFGIEFARLLVNGEAPPADKRTPVDLVTAQSLGKP